MGTHSWLKSTEMYHLSELYEDVVFYWQEMVYFMKVGDQNVE